MQGTAERVPRPMACPLLLKSGPVCGRQGQRREPATRSADIAKRWKPAAAVDEVEGICFNGPETMGRKAAYARDEGMAGVMIWEVGQDAVGATGFRMGDLRGLWKVEIE